jgi:cysteinyl-tRNA synthetase
MSLSLYNTLQRKRVTFQPNQEKHVGIYACGVTTYDVCHIGHGLQAMVYDVIRNYLEAIGYEVTYVRNYTDVDDKIIARAQELGIDALTHSQNMIDQSIADMRLLGVEPATIEPKVSEHIPEIVALIQDLIDKDQAYATEDGDVYFSVRDFKDYGKLSNRTCDDMQAGARVENKGNKRDPMDFALWKSAKPGEVSWSTPWGEGRPGWHIECSAMAMKYLGENFDIHGGGKDLIFPHHENEIAQSEASSGKPFANYWVHNGLLTVDGRKMSKSLGNFLSITDAVEKWHPEAIRYTILSHHYATNIDFNEKAFYDSYHRLLYFYNTLAKIDALIDQFPEHPEAHAPNLEVPDIRSAFEAAMSEDFNTGRALAEIGNGFKWLNDFMAAKKPKLKAKVFTLKTLAESLRNCGQILGFFKQTPAETLGAIQTYLIRDRGINVDEVKAQIDKRNQARASKDWAAADQMRDALIKQGVAIMDTPLGTTWQVLPAGEGNDDLS